MSEDRESDDEYVRSVLSPFGWSDAKGRMSLRGVWVVGLLLFAAGSFAYSNGVSHPVRAVAPVAMLAGILVLVIAAIATAVHLGVRSARDDK